MFTINQKIINKPASKYITVILVGVSASLLVLYRLFNTNKDSIRENLWAEDGLFALCAYNYNTLSCLIEPYAGYMLTLQKLLAGIVGLTPIEHWATVANIMAALISGILAGLTYYILQSKKTKIITAIFVAYIPLILPLTGFEAIGSLGSLYMILLYSTTIALAYYVDKPREQIITGTLLALSIATIPSAFALILGVAVLYYRNKITKKLTLTYSLLLTLGLTIQLTVGRTGATTRNTIVTQESINAWIEYLPKYLATYIPGLYYQENESFEYFPIKTLPNIGLYITIILVTIGLYLVIKRNEKIGILILVGLSYGLIPVLTGYANNRYFILPLSLLAAGILLALSKKLATTQTVLIIIGVTILWVPSLEASDFRKKPNPTWSSQIETINNTCKENKKEKSNETGRNEKQKILLQFTPEWPRSETVMEEKTQPYLYC